MHPWVWGLLQIWKPHSELTWSWAGAVFVANRAKAEGQGRGVSLLKGSCNFHSRVLLKLVPRPPPPLNILLLSASLCTSTLLLLCSCSFSVHLCHLWNLLLFVCVLLWKLIFQTSCAQTKISWFLKNIIVVDMVSIFFTHLIHRGASPPLPLIPLSK